MVNILIADPLDENSEKELEKIGNVTRGQEGLKDAEIVIVRSATDVCESFVDRAPKLKLVIRAGVGLDNIDMVCCEKKCIQVKNTANASSTSVAELVFALLLSIARNTVKSTNGMREGKWLKKELKGFELAGKTIGIIGYGRIGRKVAERAKAFEMKIIAYDPYIKSADVPLVGLDEAFKQADIITLHVPATPETKHLVDAKRLKEMKDNAVLINASRGTVVDENALYEALKNKTIAAAGLDVYEMEPPEDLKLAQLENAVLTPHIGANTKEAKQKVGKTVVELVKEYVGNKK